MLISLQINQILNFIAPTEQDSQLQDTRLADCSIYEDFVRETI